MDPYPRIDLHKHAVVEASAGTGKTYTIEQIVLRLLLEEQVALDQILLVTFTEKATGELKGRLRDALDSTLRMDPGLRPLLQAAIDSFDQAPIFTIHGFCRRLLAEYAFEQSQDLRREHVRDGDLIEPALREVQRRLWCREFGPQLEQVLELAEYNRDNAKKWEQKVRDLAGKYRPEFGHRLRPAPSPDDMVLEARVDQCRALLTKLRGLAGPIPEDPLTHAWYENFLYIDMNHRSRIRKLEKFLEPLLRWLIDADTELQPLLRSFCQFHETIKSSFGTSFADLGYHVFFEYISEESQGRIAATCPGLTEAIQALDGFRQSDGFQRLADQLAVKTVVAMRQVMSDVKAERSLFSFDDLIVNVAQALAPDNPGSRTFLEALRQRFRYAIVDEFQDTDPLQWRIFQRIFLEGGDARLIVVGDPKQAIFGFRGADLPTYRRATRAMTREFGAQEHHLRINRRTVGELLQPLNRLLEVGNWFPESSGISFEPVHAPPDNEDHTHIVKDGSARAPLTIVNLREAATLKKAQRQFARFAALEISRLLAAGIEFAHKRKRHTLHAGHICLLIFKRADADPLVQALREAGLPFCLYKQTGLWSSAEAEHLGIILKALAAPDDRALFRQALLTSFFGLSPTQLALCEDIPPRHAARNLFHKWLGFVDKRQWSALAQSLLDESGILVRELGAGSPDGVSLDRRASNLRFLLETLEEAAYRDNLDLLDLVGFYEKCREHGADLQADLQPIETDQPKVQITTIHASKGLEYPVVFLAGGFTRRINSGPAIYHDQDRRVFDLNPGAGAKKAQKEEETAEYCRLLYVALTRAMLKLYVPLVGSAQSTKAYAGPVTTLLAPALQQADPAGLGPKHAALVEPLSEKCPSPSNKLSAVESGESHAPSPRAVSLPVALFPALDDNLGKRRLVVRSFSSLHRASARLHFGDDTAHADDEEPDLPEDPFRGPVFGEIVHLVLETIDFAAVAAAADPAALVENSSGSRAVLDAAIAKHLPKMRGREPPEQRRHACTVKVAQLIWNGLRSSLPGLGAARLCDIPSDQRIHELEFLFPRSYGEIAPAEVRLEEGFFTGFIDLVFRHDSLYYLLDWKTNDLDAYDQAAVARAMEQSGYHRQYRLYLHALERWLGRLHGPSFDFLKHCGGVYYLFLRGMTDNSSGVFYHRPTANDLDLDVILRETHAGASPTRSRGMESP